MNWKFWQRKGVAPAAPESKMDDLERAILDDYRREPASWRFVEYPGGSIRSGKGNVTVSMNSALARATCGAVTFSGEFSPLWWSIAKNSVEAEKTKEAKIAYQRDLDALRKYFLE